MDIYDETLTSLNTNEDFICTYRLQCKGGCIDISLLLLQDRGPRFISSRNSKDSRGFEAYEAMQTFINLRAAELTAAVRADGSTASRWSAELKSNEADLLREADRAWPRNNKGSRLDTSTQLITPQYEESALHRSS